MQVRRQGRSASPSRIPTRSPSTAAGARGCPVYDDATREPHVSSQRTGERSGWGWGRTGLGDVTHEAGEVRKEEMAGRGWGMPSSSPHPPAYNCAPDADTSPPLPPRHALPVRCALRLFGSRRAHCLRCLRHALPSDDGAPAFPRTPDPGGRTPRKTPCAPRRVSGDEDGRPALCAVRGTPRRRLYPAADDDHSCRPMDVEDSQGSVPSERFVALAHPHGTYSAVFAVSPI